MKTMQMHALWLMVAGLMLIPLQTFGQTSIAVISDPHVISQDMAVNSEAWETTVNNSRKLLDYSKEVFDVLMTKFTSEKPDVLLISGDLTEDGGEASHNYVAAELAKLEAAGVKVYVVPGNHDIGTHLSANDFAEKYRAFGYDDEESVLDANSLSYACEPVPGLILIGIDSHNGTLAEGTLSWVCTQAENARQAGKQVIAMMHHPLFPHISKAEMFIDTYAIADYENVRNSLANAGIKVILTGHFHVTDNAKDWNEEDETAEIYDLNTGSTISYPCDYRLLTLNMDGDEPGVTVKRYSIEEVPSNPDFRTMAKTRLAASSKALALSYISKNSLAAIMTEDQKDKLATLAASLFVVHAEGDEQNSSDAAALKTTFEGYMGNMFYKAAITAFGFGDMFYGVVENTSNYGTEHAYQCADGDLSISLPDLRASVTLAADGWASFCSARDLTLPEDGLKGYIVTAVSPTSAMLQEVTQVPANTGVLLQGAGGATYRLANATEALDALADNLLLPALEETEAPANAFVLACKNDVTGFYPVRQGIAIPAQKAYLVVGGSSARMLSMSNDNTTGIVALPEKDASAAVYTLQGVRVVRPQKGLNIKNGKLIMVK